MASDCAHEVCRWIEAATAQADVQLADEFFRQLRGSSRKDDKTVLVANLLQFHANRAFPWKRGPGAAVDKEQLHLAQLTMKLSRLFLKKILDHVTSSCTEANRPSSLPLLVSSEAFLLSVACCASELIAQAFQGREFPAHMEQVHAAYDVFVALRLVEAHVLPGLQPEAPPQLHALLTRMALQVCEDLAWRDGSSLYLAIVAIGMRERSRSRSRSRCGGESAEGAGADLSISGSISSDTVAAVLDRASNSNPLLLDHSCLDMFLESCRQLGHEYIATLFALVQRKAPEQLQGAEALQDAACSVVNRIVSKSLQLLFGRHFLTICVCCLYGVARATGIHIPFRTIAQAMALADDGSALSRRDLLLQVELQPAERDLAAPLPPPTQQKHQPRRATTYGSVRQFYNSVFLPLVEDELREAGAMVQQQLQARRDAAAAAASQQPQSERPAVPALGSEAAAARGTAAEKPARLQSDRSSRMLFRREQVRSHADCGAPTDGGGSDRRRSAVQVGRTSRDSVTAAEQRHRKLGGGAGEHCRVGLQDVTNRAPRRLASL